MKSKGKKIAVVIIALCLVLAVAVSIVIITTSKGKDGEAKSDVAATEEIKKAESSEAAADAKEIKVTISPDPQVLTATDSGSTTIIKSVEYCKDDEDDDAIVLTLDFTNNDTEERRFFDENCFNMNAYQNGEKLSLASVRKDANCFSNAQPGETIEIKESYKVKNMNAPVQFSIYDYWSEDVLATYTITLSK